MTVAALYVRVSTEDQARHGYSLAAQVEACRARAELAGAGEVRLFADEGVSGALLARPGLDALREAVRTRVVDLVVVWDPDRLSRNLSHQLLLTEEIERARVRLEFVNFEWKATPEGQLFYALRGAIAQYEKEKIRERTGRGRLQKARQGKLPLAFRPYGYAYDRETASLVPDPAEAATVADIFRWFLEGDGPGAVARRLNCLGVPARKGGRWHRTVVRQILMNPVYAGVFYANRWDTAGCSLNRHRPEADRVRPSLRPRDEWVEVPVPPLVEPSRWEEAQALLACSRRLWAGKAKAEYLLSGLVVCGRCGRPMSGTVVTDWGVRRRTYTCRKPGAACGQAVPAEPLEEAVWERVVDGLVRPALRDAASQPPPDRASRLERERQLLAAAIVRAEVARASVLSVLEQGGLSAVEAAAALARTRTRLDELHTRQADLEACVETAPATPVTDLSALLDRIRQRRLDAMEPKRLVRSVLSRIVVSGRTAVLHARLPAAFSAADLTATSKS